MDDTSPPLPKIQPLFSFKEVLAWHPGQDEYNVSHTPLHIRPEPLHRSGHAEPVDSATTADSPVQSPSRPEDCKVIACHDMAGGYAEDAFSQGNDYSTVYNIQYWNYIDIFIYFSHHRITIPPAVWTNAAHRNGVRCLGNIITEHLEGMLETDEMVSGPGQALVDEVGDDIVNREWFSRTYADKLVDMAVYYKFDGWFINIESPLRGGAAQAKQTIAFLAYLREQIHARIPGGELIWYDSVISTTGEVRWQDRLSEKNYKFFEQSDGIFVNYTWKEHFVAESVKLAGPRNREVYTGIDVWGRNTFGGGKYTAYKALKVIQREKSSCAIFAPAWTYESLGKDKGFMTHDRFFWAGYLGAGIHAESLPLSSFHEETARLLSGHLGANPDDKDPPENKDFQPVSAYIPARPSGTSSWFYSNFDRGFGNGFWVDGEKVSNKPWSYLSQQSLPPSMTKDIFVLGQGYSIQAPVPGDTILRWVLSPEEAYHGGTSIVIQEFSGSEQGPSPNHSPASVSRTVSTNNTVPPRTKSILVPLFGTQISMHNAQISTIELIYKPCQDDVQVGIHFGLLAVDTGKPLLDSNRMGRKLLKEELLQALHPEFRQGEHLVSNNNNSSTLPDKDLVCLVTLDDPDRRVSPEAGLAIGLQQNQRRLYTRETLSNGWQRLVLHLSGLLNPLVESSSNETSSALYSIVLSQLGITLSCQDQGSLLQGQDSRPLAILGSLAVVPTWSMEHKGSYVQGVVSQDTQSILLEHPVQGSASSTHLKVQGVSQYLEQPQPHPQQEATIITKGLEGGNGPIPIFISSTITWNIGFPVDNQSGSITLASSSSSSSSQISTSEYSHYCIYLSLERSGQGPPNEMTNSTGEKEKVAEQGVAFWVGTAFTHRYRIANFEFGLEQHATTTTATDISTIASEPNYAGEGDLSSTSPSGTTRERMPPVEIQRLLAGREIWVWVQGIRRDGRSDERRDWGRSRLL